MRIGILTSYFYHRVKEIHGQDRIIFGGAERYLVELCNLLKSLGHEVTVFQPIDGKKQVTKKYGDIPIVCLPVGNGGWDLSTNSMLNMTFNEVGRYFDLRIYFATFLCWPHVIKPAIAISHGIFWDYPYHIVNTGGEIERNEFWRRQLYGFTAPDLTVAVDYNVKRVLSAIQPGIESNIYVIQNFVDTKTFKPKEKDWQGIRVLYPRRLTMLRGCNEFIRAAQMLSEYEFLVCGNATEAEDEARVRQWSQKSKNLRSIWQPMERMAEVYQQADIAVVPTRAAEGLSLSLLEAMACGLPIISTAVGGIGDAVINGYNALLFDPDYDDLAEYIRILAEDKGMRHTFGVRNKKIAKSFDVEVWRNRWASLLASL